MSSTRSRSAVSRPAPQISRSAGSGTAKSSRGARRNRAEQHKAQPIVLEPSSGNVYRDLGFSAAEAEFLLLRSRLMRMVGQVITERRLTQTAAARLFGVSQPRVSDVVRGRVERFTIDSLVEMLAKARVRLDLVALPTHRRR